MASANVTRSGEVVEFQCNRRQLQRVMGDFYQPDWMTDDLEEALKDNRWKKSLETNWTPWSCTSNYFWKDLGLHYYPRFVRVTVCPTVKCWYGLFSCKAKSYKITVFKRRANNKSSKSVRSQISLIGGCMFDRVDTITATSSDTLNIWEFHNLMLPICCSCVQF